MTAWRGEDRIQGIEAGDDFLTKPVDERSCWRASRQR